MKAATLEIMFRHSNPSAAELPNWYRIQRQHYDQQQSEPAASQKTIREANSFEMYYDEERVVGDQKNSKE